MKPVVAIVALAVQLAACGGKSAADYQNDARRALDAGDTAKAIAVVDEGLAKDAVRQDAAGAWRLEQIRLDALAKSGKGADLKIELERVAGTHPQQVNASLYRSLADRVKAAGDVPTCFHASDLQHALLALLGIGRRRAHGRAHLVNVLGRALTFAGQR